RRGWRPSISFLEEAWCFLRIGGFIGYHGGRSRARAGPAPRSGRAGRGAPARLPCSVLFVFRPLAETVLVGGFEDRREIAVEDVGGHRGRVDDHLVPGGLLGAVEGAVGCLEQVRLVADFHIGGERGDPRADRDANEELLVLVDV